MEHGRRREPRPDAYQPQQSVLKLHAEQRQTACIRYMSAPHRSQSTLSLGAGQEVIGEMGRGAGLGASGSAIVQIW